MGCSSKSESCTCYCAYPDGTPYTYDCGSKPNPGPRERCCPDCYSPFLKMTFTDSSDHEIICKRDNRIPPDPYYIGSNGSCHQQIITYIYDCKKVCVTTTPPPTTPPPPPPGNCNSGG
jgi:hypothetical protein